MSGGWKILIGSIFAETIEVARRAKQGSELNVDATVQEKAIAFPTDARLYHKASKTLGREAKSRNINLRQSYKRVGKKAFVMQSRYANASLMKRADRPTRKLKTSGNPGHRA